MKNILIVSLIMLTGCSIKEEKQVKETEVTRSIRIIEIDSCEYIQSDVYSGYDICHKGNCKFCKQRNIK